MESIQFKKRYRLKVLIVSDVKLHESQVRLINRLNCIKEVELFSVFVRTPRDKRRMLKSQAGINNSSKLNQFLGLALYKLLFSNHIRIGKTGELSDVINLNSKEFLKIINDSGIDVILLYGTGIIRKKYLERINIPIYNIHSSNPRLIRGQPVLFWEIYYKMTSHSIVIHTVTDVLDAGSIVFEKEFSFNSKYSGFKALKYELNNLESRQLSVVQGFFEDMIRGELKVKSFKLGPLRTNPSFIQILKVLCQF